LHNVGVIVFGSDQEVAELMKAVKRMNATGHFNWIGSDGWSARALVSEGKKSSQVSFCLTFRAFLNLNFSLTSTASLFSRGLKIWNFMFLK